MCIYMYICVCSYSCSHGYRHVDVYNTDIWTLECGASWPRLGFRPQAPSLGPGAAAGPGGPLWRNK